MGIFDNEQKEGFNKFQQKREYTDKDGKLVTLTDDKLVTQVYSYIHQQLNDTARLGIITTDQFKLLSERASEGLFTLIYCNNYIIGEDLIDKDSVYISSSNYMYMLFTRVLNGADRQILLADIEAKKQTIVMGK